MLKNQFRFMPGWSTIEPIFCVSQLIEKYREMKNNLTIMIIDYEKAYNRVPRKIIWRVLEKEGYKMHVKII